MVLKDRFALVDIQGFIINKENDFVLKELSFLSINTDGTDNGIHHFIFSSPFSWQQLDKDSRLKALWLFAYHHGFYWNQGELSHEEIDNCIKPLLQKQLTIFVKGREKIRWLKRICKNPNLDIRDIDEEHNLRFSTEAKKISHTLHCRKHRRVRHCALQNVKILDKWFRNHEW